MGDDKQPSKVASKKTAKRNVTFSNNPEVRVIDQDLDENTSSKFKANALKHLEILGVNKFDTQDGMDELIEKASLSEVIMPKSVEIHDEGITVSYENQEEVQAAIKNAEGEKLNPQYINEEGFEIGLDKVALLEKELKANLGAVVEKMVSEAEAGRGEDLLEGTLRYLHNEHEYTLEKGHYDRAEKVLGEYKLSGLNHTSEKNIPPPAAPATQAERAKDEPEPQTASPTSSAPNNTSEKVLQQSAAKPPATAAAPAQKESEPRPVSVFSMDDATEKYEGLLSALWEKDGIFPRVEILKEGILLEFPNEEMAADYRAGLSDSSNPVQKDDVISIPESINISSDENERDFVCLNPVLLSNPETELCLAMTEAERNPQMLEKILQELSEELEESTDLEEPQYSRQLAAAAVGLIEGNVELTTASREVLSSLHEIKELTNIPGIAEYMAAEETLGTDVPAAEDFEHDIDISIEEATSKMRKATDANDFETAISQGADISAKDLNGMTALHFASSKSKDHLQALLTSQAWEEIDESAKRDMLNAKDTSENTPVMRAILTGNAESVSELVKMGADITEVRTDGKSVMHLAAERGAKFMEAITKSSLWESMDTSQKSDIVNARDMNDSSPLHGAQDAETVAILREAGADVNARNKEGIAPVNSITNQAAQSALIKPQEGRAGAKTPKDFGVPEKTAAAMNAARNGKWDEFAQALDQGASAKHKGPNGRSLLHFAIDKCPASKRQEVVKKLVEKGADVNEVDPTTEKSPLFMATTAGMYDVVSELVQDPNLEVRAKFSHTTKERSMGSASSRTAYAAAKAELKSAQARLQETGKAAEKRAERIGKGKAKNPKKTNKIEDSHSVATERAQALIRTVEVLKKPHMEAKLAYLAARGTTFTRDNKSKTGTIDQILEHHDDPRLNLQEALFAAAKNGHPKSLEKLLERCSDEGREPQLGAMLVDGKNLFDVAYEKAKSAKSPEDYEKCMLAIARAKQRSDDSPSVSREQIANILRPKSGTSRSTLASSIIEAVGSKTPSPLSTPDPSTQNILLHDAILIGDKKAAEQLISLATAEQLQHPNKEGLTVLHVAARRGKKDLVQKILARSEAQGMDTKTYVELPDFDTGKNAMHHAAEAHKDKGGKKVKKDSAEIIKFLVEGSRADVTLQDKANKMPIEYAYEAEHKKAAASLVDYGSPDTKKGRETKIERELLKELRASRKEEGRKKASVAGATKLFEKTYPADKYPERYTKTNEPKLLCLIVGNNSNKAEKSIKKLFAVPGPYINLHSNNPETHWEDLTEAGRIAAQKGNSALIEVMKDEISKLQAIGEGVGRRNELLQKFEASVKNGERAARIEQIGKSTSSPSKAGPSSRAAEEALREGTGRRDSIRSDKAVRVDERDFDQAFRDQFLEFLKDGITDPETRAKPLQTKIRKESADLFQEVLDSGKGENCGDEEIDGKRKIFKVDLNEYTNKTIFFPTFDPKTGDQVFEGDKPVTSMVIVGQSGEIIGGTLTNPVEHSSMPQEFIDKVKQINELALTQAAEVAAEKAPERAPTTPDLNQAHESPMPKHFYPEDMPPDMYEEHGTGETRWDIQPEEFKPEISQKLAAEAARAYGAQLEFNKEALEKMAPPAGDAAEPEALYDILLHQETLKELKIVNAGLAELMKEECSAHIDMDQINPDNLTAEAYEKFLGQDIAEEFPEGVSPGDMVEKLTQDGAKIDQEISKMEQSLEKRQESLMERSKESLSEDVVYAARDYAQELSGAETFFNRIKEEAKLTDPRSYRNTIIEDEDLAADKKELEERKKAVKVAKKETEIYFKHSIKEGEVGSARNVTQDKYKEFLSSEDNEELPEGVTAADMRAKLMFEYDKYEESLDAVEEIIFKQEAALEANKKASKIETPGFDDEVPEKISLEDASGDGRELGKIIKDSNLKISDLASVNGNTTSQSLERNWQDLHELEQEFKEDKETLLGEFKNAAGDLEGKGDASKVSDEDYEKFLSGELNLKDIDTAANMLAKLNAEAAILEESIAAFDVALERELQESKAKEAGIGAQTMKRTTKGHKRGEALGRDAPDTNESVLERIEMLRQDKVGPNTLDRGDAILDETSKVSVKNLAAKLSGNLPHKPKGETIEEHNSVPVDLMRKSLEGDSNKKTEKTTPVAFKTPGLANNRKPGGKDRGVAD